MVIVIAAIVVGFQWKTGKDNRGVRVAGSADAQSQEIKTRVDAPRGTVFSKREDSPVDPDEAASALKVLLLAVDQPELLENLNFQPVGANLKVNKHALTKFGLQSCVEPLQKAIDHARERLHKYDQDHLIPVAESGGSKMYFIPGRKDSEIRVQLDQELSNISSDPRIAKLLSYKLKQNLEALTGDFAESNRVLIFSALGPGDEPQGYPEMRHSVSSGIINPKLGLDEAKQYIDTNHSGKFHEMIPTSNAVSIAFKDIPEEFTHLVEK